MLAYDWLALMETTLMEQAQTECELVETLLDERQLAQKLRVSVGTLRYWRIVDKGPSFHKIGQLVRYSPSRVNDWLSRCASGRRPGSSEMQ